MIHLCYTVGVTKMIRTQVNVEEEFWNRLDEIATEWKKTGRTDRHAGAGTVASHLLERLKQRPDLLSQLLEPLGEEALPKGNRKR